MQTARPFFALTAHGLEDVAAREAATLHDVTITEVGYRRIAGRCDGPMAELLRLRAVDDVFLALASWTGIDRPRAALGRLRDLSRRLDLRDAQRVCGAFRRLGRPPTFAVTASFVGRRNYATAEIKQAVAAGVADRLGWSYATDDARADLSVRVFIEHERAHVGVRLAAAPLHARLERRVVCPGALRPPVAAGLVALAGVAPGARLLDPCCGSGTILIEATHRGALAWGGDIAPSAVRAARQNMAAAGVTPRACVLDCRRLPLADASVDLIVSNPPWGEQVPVAGGLAAFYQQSLRELRRVLAPGGRIALLTGAPELARLPGLRCRQRREISLAGQRPTIFVFEA